MSMISARCIDDKSPKPGYPSSPPRSSRSRSTPSWLVSYMPIYKNLLDEDWFPVLPASDRHIIREPGREVQRTFNTRAIALRTFGIAAIFLVLATALVGCNSQEAGEGSNVPTVRGAAAREKPFVGSSLRAPYHLPDCRWAQKITEDHLVGYDSAADAEADGRRPCRVCRPE